MVDYWVSNAKKYCDFCKCWISDNKPSVDFHEKGKRHKENVALRLKNLSRQSVKDKREKQKLDEDLKNMEKAAIQAYMKDVERNADYTSQQLNKQLNEANSSIHNDHSKETQKEKEPEQVESESNTSVWHEAVSDEGYTYYWNMETGESVWEPPEGGYVSLDQQNKSKNEDEKQVQKDKREVNRKILEEVKRKEENDKILLEEQRACLEREKMKERRVKEEIPETESKTVIGPVPRANPYGSWTVVIPKKPKQVDLQLPHLNHKEIKVPVLNTSEPEIKFKEKNTVSLESEGSHDVNFKKRKLNLGSKKNLRQRLDDD